jgi:hypothetical protein
MVPYIGWRVEGIIFSETTNHNAQQNWDLSGDTTKTQQWRSSISVTNNTQASDSYWLGMITKHYSFIYT